MASYDYFKLRTDDTNHSIQIPSGFTSFVKEKIAGFAGQKQSDEYDQSTTEQAETASQSRFYFWFNNADIDPWLPSMSAKQRMLGFVVSILLGSLSFSLSLILLPILATPAAMRKFVLLHSLGSMIFLISFGFIWGPYNHLKSLFSRERIGFTLVYIGFLFFALFSVLSLKSAFLALAAFIGQILTLLFQMTKWVPGGQIGLKYFAKGVYRTLSGTANSLLPT